MGEESSRKNPNTSVNRVALQRLERSVDEMIRVLRGSNGETGLIADVRSLTREVRDHIEDESKCPIKDVTTILYGSKEDASNRGVVADVVELKKWRGELRSWYVLFVGAIVVGVANILLNIFK